MNWKKLLVNVGAVFAGSFATYYGAGATAKGASGAAAITTLANLSGLLQAPPQQPQPPVR